MRPGSEPQAVREVKRSADRGPDREPPGVCCRMSMPAPRQLATTLLSTSLLAVATVAGALRAQAAEGDWFALGAFGLSPAPRNSVALYDARRERLLLLGGDRIDSMGFTRQSTTVFAIAGVPSRDWAPLLEGSGETPLRSGAGAVYDSVTDRVLLWGGARIFPSGLVAPLDADLFRMDAATGAWTREPAASPAPLPRRDHGLVLDRARRRVLVFGGRDRLDAFLGDVWARDIDGSAGWDSIETVGFGPAPRLRAAVLFDDARDRLLVLAGEGFGPTRFSDAWELDFTVDPPTWRSLPLASGRLEGPATCAVDRQRDRALALGADAAQAYEWRFASDSVRAMTRLLSPPHPPSGDPPVAVVVNDAHGFAVLATSVGSQGSTTPVWRLSVAVPLGFTVPAQFTVAPPTATFALGLTTVRWDATASGLRELPRPLWSGSPPFEFAAEVVRTTSGFFPDMGGALYVDRSALAAGRTYPVGLQWVGPSGYDTTAIVDITTPFGPLEVSVVVDSIVGTSQGIVTEWHLSPVDSLRQFAPTQVEVSMDAAPWVPLVPGAFPDSSGRFRVTHGVLALGHAFEYRIRWESPIGTRRSAPVRFVWISEPAFEGIEAGVDSFVALWRVPDDVPFTVQLMGLREGAAPVLLGEGVADPTGAIRIAVHGVRPDTLYRLQAAWVNGGVARVASAFQYRSGPPPVTRVALAVRGGLGSAPTLRMSVPAGRNGLVTLHDIGGRIIWGTQLAPGVHEVQPPFQLTPSGLYFARLTHASGTVTARVVIVQ